MILYFVLIVILFILLTAFPFLLSFGVPLGKDSTLVVPFDNKKDPRYFAKSFRKIMEKALEEGKGERFLYLSQTEPFVRGRDLKKQIKSGKVEMLVFSSSDFETTEPLKFEKEIYAAGDAKIAEKTVLRAIAAKNVTLSENCRVLRWCDAEEKMTVFPGNNLGISCTCNQYLAVSEGCTFTRLYAPMIEVLNRSSLNEVHRPISLLEGDLELQISEEILDTCETVYARSRVDNSIIARHRITVEEFSIVTGHIKSQEGIHLGREVTVYGNLFAEKAIVMESGCRVYGNIFSQTSVYIDSGCIIGRVGRTKSLIGRQSVILNEGVTVFGYVGCENKGYTVDKDEYIKMAERAKEA